MNGSFTNMNTAVESITVTDAAREHFKQLLEKEDTPGMNLRVIVSNPGQSSAEVGVTFWPLEDFDASDIPLNFETFTVFIDKASEAALEDALIDFKPDSTGGQLSIKAPFLKGREPIADSPLADRVKYVIESEINPNLAGHGGKVSLVDIIEEGTVVILQFGGGCHGCGMANVTLKHGIEKTLKEKFPEIVEIRDITDHTTGENPYC